jgi:hypothetical protein
MIAFSRQPLTVSWIALVMIGERGIDLPDVQECDATAANSSTTAKDKKRPLWKKGPNAHEKK